MVRKRGEQGSFESCTRGQVRQGDFRMAPSFALQGLSIHGLECRRVVHHSPRCQVRQQTDFGGRKFGVGERVVMRELQQADQVTFDF